MVESDEAGDLPGRTRAPSLRTGAAVSGETRLLERERELAECTAALERALAGGGGIVVVEGAAGIGKTEFLRAVRAQAVARDVRVLAARGVEVERELACGGVRQLLEPVFRALAPEEAARLLSGAARPAKRLLGTEPDEAAPPADPSFSMLNALYWVLAGLSDAEPLLLAVDDAHWLDPPSLRLLDFLLPRIEELHALVVAAARPPQDADEDALLRRVLVDSASQVIRLGPLSRAAVEEFVRARLGEQPHPAFVDACADVTAGNPFYLAELLGELAQRGARPSSSEAADVRTIGPRNIALALRFRAASSSDGIALARALAVLGDGVPLEQAAALAGLERGAAARAADDLTRDATLASGAELAFAHPIVRTAVYDDLGPRERETAHRRAAQLLHSAGAPVGRVAAHLVSTDPAGDSWVVEVLRAAAAAVLAQGAPDAASQYLRRALAEPPDKAIRAELLLELGRAEASALDPAAPAHLAEAYALAADLATRADAAGPAALALLVAGRTEEAIAVLATAADELAHHDRQRALELEAQLVSLAMVDPSAAALHLPHLTYIDEEIAADSPGARMLLCHLAYRRMWRSRDAAYAADIAERALGDGLLLAERGPEAPELNSVAMTLICADRLEPATRLLDAALSQARERGSRYGFGHVSFLRSELAYRQGALADVEAEARASLGIWEVPTGQIGAVVATSMLIAALVERGALDEAADAVNAIGLAEADFPPQGHYNLLLCFRGRLRLARGELAGGLGDLLECGRRNVALEIRNPILVPWRFDAALAHRARGELDAARALAEEELAAARDWGTPGAIGAAQRLAARLGSADEAIALLQEATAALADSPARLEYARALVDLGDALRRANRRIDAREPLSLGLDLADRCGAKVLGRRAREELAATGARPRRVQLTGIDALTASERRVAQMAAQGLGNVEIAQTLFVTRKTVEKHLSNAYTKLGVSVRAELAPHFPERVSRDGDAHERQAPS
jgi:DNA-binding CsgD family transcriptional regulator